MVESLSGPVLDPSYEIRETYADDSKAVKVQQLAHVYEDWCSPSGSDKDCTLTRTKAFII
jgi:hypothetical protein